jgi:WD40 repeat protein
MAGGHTTPPAAYYTADGQTIVSAGDATVKFFSASSGTLLKTIIPFAFLMGSGTLVLSPDGKYLAVTGQDTNGGSDSIKIFTVPAGTLSYTIPLGDLGSPGPGSFGIAFSPDNKMLAFSAGGNAGVYTLATSCAYPSTTVCSFQPIPLSLDATPFFFSTDGSSLIMTAFDPPHLVLYPHPAAGGSFYYDYGLLPRYGSAFGVGNSSYYVIGGLYYGEPGPGEINVYPAGYQGCPVPTSGSCTYPNPVLTISNQQGYGVALSPNGAEIAAGSYSSPPSTSIYGFPSGILLGSFPLPDANNALTTVSFSADSQSLVTTDALIHVLDANNAALAFDVTNNWARLTVAGFSGNGAETVSVGDDGIAVVRNASDGSPISLIQFGVQPNWYAAGAALSKDGKTAAVAVGGAVYQGGNTTLYDVATGTPTVLSTSLWGQLAFLPDGQTLAVADGNYGSGIQFFNYQTGAAGDLIGASQPFSITPDGSWMAAFVPGAGTWNPAIFKLSDLKQTATVTGISGPGPMAISPDGTKVAGAYNPGSSGSPSVQIYSANGTLLHALTGNAGFVTAVAFSPDGHTLAAADNTALVCFFSVGTGQLLKTFNQETGVPGSNLVEGGNINSGFGGVSSLAYSPDGTTIYWSRDDATSALVKNPFYEPLLTAVTAPSPVIGGDTAEGTVTISADAPASGIVVNLKSTSVTVPASVTVPSGSTSATFSISTATVTSDQRASITATTGGVPQTAAIIIEPLLVQSLSLGAKSVTGGSPINGNLVNMNGAAPADTQVTLTSSNPAVASVPASVTVAEGDTASPAFTITTTAVTKKTAVTISASYGGKTVSLQIAVLP